MFSTVGGRKFFMVMGCCLVFTGLFLLGRISEQTLEETVLINTALYVVGNGAERMVSLLRVKP